MKGQIRLSESLIKKRRSLRQLKAVNRISRLSIGPTLVNWYSIFRIRLIRYCKACCLAFAYAPLLEIFDQAAVKFQTGKHYERLAMETTGNESIYNWARATRAFTKCQVRARQVKNALTPPPKSPDDLGLKPFGYWEK